MNRFNLTLRTRIYLSMLTLILISFITTGVTAYYNFKRENEEYQEQRLLRKVFAVEASIEYFINNQGADLESDSITSMMADKVCELADINRIPISVYDRKGHLLISASSTTRPSEFLPIRVDDEAMGMFQNGDKRAAVERHIADETESVLNYWYLYDIQDQPIAIVGVRYDKSVINKDEISRFLSNLTYMFIALFIIASVLGYFISNYITKSLEKIADRMHNIELGKRNEPIEWKSEDEIGRLVHQYNEMLREVEKSAKLLKKSERETAWREMAKQVAHEIKNPLTPMKLRVQHLKRAWEDEAPDFGEKLNTVSSSLIEQIDALTNIANEFSHFAKMPKANKEKLNLDEVLNTCMDLFDDHNEVKINYNYPTGIAPGVYADKEQLTRVFINLITNSIQAIPEERNGKIDVRIKEYEDLVIVEVEDNGAGISKEQETKIFEPNFTTKSTGTGLGLAMSKNIIENAGGDIWFKTKENLGTTFFVSLPIKK